MAEELGWFDRWFLKKFKKVWDWHGNQVVSGGISIGASKAYPSNSFNGDNGLNMQVHGADGGYVVSFNHYDHVKDRNHQSLHVINRDEDFAERISQIITLELIKRGITA